MTQRLSTDDLPLPPLEHASRVGCLDGAGDPFELYEAIGRAIRKDLIDALPDGYSLEGRRILDFGCGAGRVLRHFVADGLDAGLWGCDIDAESIEWLSEQLSPSLNVFVNDDLPPLDQEDESFDLVYCVSVFTHLARSWSAWLVELHRVLKPGGLLLATFMGEGRASEIAGEEWDENRVGMLILRPGQGWELGGPMVLHSPWWIREHWGRLFEVVSLTPDGFAGQGAGKGQGMVVLRKKEVSVTVTELEELSSDPREALALAHNVDRLVSELEELRPAWKELSDERLALSKAIARVEADAAAASERLREISASLLEANQRLAQLPPMEAEVETRRAESVWLVEERARLEEQIVALQARVDASEG